jgi:hypothetical protein
VRRASSESIASTVKRSRPSTEGSARRRGSATVQSAREGCGVKRQRPALFNGYVTEDGVRRRLRREELALAWRLWCRHADVRLGRVKAS